MLPTTISTIIDLIGETLASTDSTSGRVAGRVDLADTAPEVRIGAIGKRVLDFEHISHVDRSIVANQLWRATYPGRRNTAAC